MVLVLLLLLLVPSVAHAGSWRRPVEGEALRSFALGPNPYARGQHRGVDLAAAPGSPVRSACGGSVSFAGRVPGGGLTVSVRCGSLIATLQQLGAVGVRRGARVLPGTPLGLAGRSGDPRTRRAHVHLGARVAASGRYVDPLALLGGGRPMPPATAPWRSPRGGPLGPAPAPLPRRVPAGPRFAPAPWSEAPVRAPALPWLVWAGLASVAVALPLGGVLHVRRRRRRIEPRPVSVTTG